MCFYNDYDWTAQVVNETRPVAEKPTTCDECGIVIQEGQTYYHVFMEEREECYCTYHGEADKCECEEPNYGETFAYDRCLECDKFLEAVQHVEEDAGCSGDETRPALGEMLESLWNGRPGEVKRYFRRALRDYPELKASGYLGRIGKSLFV